MEIVNDLHFFYYNCMSINSNMYKWRNFSHKNGKAFLPL